MIRANMIPDEVVRAALLTDEWLGMREVIAAALNAWPGMMPVSEVFTAGGDFYRPHLILPLPAEVSDE